MRDLLKGLKCWFYDLIIVFLTIAFPILFIIIWIKIGKNVYYFKNKSKRFFLVGILISGIVGFFAGFTVGALIEDIASKIFRKGR